MTAAKRPATSGAAAADRQQSAQEREIAALRAELDHCAASLRDAENELRATVGHVELVDAEFTTASQLKNVGSWSADLTAGRYTWSEKLHRIFGTDPSDPPPDAAVYTRMIHPDDRDRVVATMKAAALSGSSYDLEYRIIRTDGEVRTIRGRGRFPLNDQGVPVRLGGIVQDTTDAKLFKRELQLSRDLFAGVLDAATEQSLIATDPNGLITVFNTGAERMLGYSAAEMIGTSPQRLHDWDEIEARAAELGIEPGFAVFLEKAAAGIPETRQWTYVTRDGRRLQASISVTATRDRHGAINGFIKVGTDVTERVEAEAALQESEGRFRDLFDYAPNGMMLVSLEEHDQGRIIQANPALTTLTGYSQEQLLTMSLMDLTTPDDVEGYHKRLTALSEGRPTALSIERHWIRADGQDLWVQCNISPKAEAGSPCVVAQVEDITARRELEARLTHQALHDPLTGLPNRLLLMDRIAHALAASIRSEAHVAVLYLDLDGFKLINDTAGHAAGDVVLAEVSARIDRALRPGDTLARLGGDEFAIVCEALVDANAAMKIADRVLAAVRGQYTVADGTSTLSASVGVSISAENSTAERMLLEADQAMYRAKHAGKNRSRMGGNDDPESLAYSARALRVIRIGSELTTALDKEELTFYGQPVVNMLSGDVVAVESLIRWHHPSKGVVGPGEFLDVAEASDLMLPIGRLALLESSRMAATWATELGPGSPSVHVNVSGRQLESGNLCADVDDALQRYGLDPSQLVLELTETHMPLLVDSMREELLRMREMGVKVAIDDLGTGFSSLTRITELPVDILKIDISFVAGMQHDPSCAAVVRGILAIGQALGLGVIAEGVETPVQADLLLEYGCNIAQGYLFSRPLPEADLTARLALSA